MSGIREYSGHRRVAPHTHNLSHSARRGMTYTLIGPGRERLEERGRA
jgi:hypothetical protein